MLYYGSPFNVLSAIDPKSGEELWTFDPQSWKDRGDFWGFARGIAYWESGDKKRIFYGTASDRLYSIDIETGQPDPEFGEGGFVDLGKGLRRRIDRSRYCITSPPIICRDVVVVGSGITDWHDRPPAKYSTPGDVRGFDAHTGEQVWVFQTVPQEGEYGNDTWENDAWQTYGQANVWSAMSADDELGYVYLPVSSTTHNHYGGERPGANLFSQTLVCLKATTGERVWHYQLIHHGLWNYDPPAPPVLVDIEVQGQSDQSSSFGQQTSILLRIGPHDWRASLADRRARGAPGENPRRAKLADPALPQQACALRPPGATGRRPDRLYA